MINLNQEIQNFPPINLNDIACDVSEVPDNIKNSIILYNKALENLRMDSEDIAIIELKKAISMNPEFHEAMNLLGICYGYTNEHFKASEMFEKVIAAENNSIKALKYLGQLNSVDISTQLNESKRRSGNKKKDADKNNAKTSEIFKDAFNFTKYRKADILKYIIGFLCGALVLFAFSLPYYFKEMDINKTKVLEDSKKAFNNSENVQYESKIAQLNDDNKKLKSDVDSLTTDLDYYKNAVKIFEIDKLVSAKNYEAAADKLVLLKTFAYKGDEKAKFDALYGDAIPKAAWKVFNEGLTLLTAKKYQEAVNKLSKVQIYGTDWQYMDLTLYYMGNCYKEMSDSRNAVATYQKLKDNYPKSQYARYAELRIKELTQVP